MMSTNKHMAITFINSVKSIDWANNDDMLVSNYSNNRCGHQRLVDKVIEELT